MILCAWCKKDLDYHKETQSERCLKELSKRVGEMSQFIRPLCDVCGFELVGKIGTVIVVCVVCGTEFDLVVRN